MSNTDSTGINPVNKSWYSTLNNTLQIPINPNAMTSNRISPLINTKRISSSPSLIKYDESLSPITHLFKRLARTSSTMNSSSSWLLLRRKEEGVCIYMKSPHVVANGELTGTLVIQLLDDLIVKEIQLTFIGIEAVANSQHHQSRTKTQHQFYNLQILNINSEENIKSYMQQKIIVLPFSITLAPQLSGTFIDKKGSIQYHLQSEIISNHHEKLTIMAKKPVLVYPNVTSLKCLKGVTDLYLPIIENSKQVWKSLTSSVILDISLSRTVWMPGAPIYVMIKIQNSTIYTVCDIKLELLRKQNTCCIAEGDDNTTIIPLTSTCEIISQSSLANSGWWQPLEANAKDHITMTIEAPLNQVTVRSQKFIDISFSIRMLICSPQRTDTVTEIPIMLVHPIAMDPPPLLCNKNNIESHQNDTATEAAAKPPLLESSVSYTSSLSNTKPISISSVSIYRNGSITQSNTTKKLEKMKKSISTWRTRISRKISITRMNEQSNPPRPEISSPIISSFSTDSCNKSIASSIYSSPSSSRHHYPHQQQDISSIICRNNTQRSVMKFGHIKGPKRFGQQPGCLGDAGLDIRNCFNVATATEVMQSYAAEKVEIPDDIPFFSDNSSDSDEDYGDEATPTNKYPPYLEPVQLIESNFKWKEGFVAPPEKCQLDMVIDEVDTSSNSSRKLSISKYPQDGSNTKRMLASSRHLMHLQRKSAQVSKKW